MIKHALITGGTGGLGLATAELLIKQGWHVFLADFDMEALEQLPVNNQRTILQMDVSDMDSINAAFKTVSKQADYLDVIINFAGILAVGSVAELDEDVLGRVLDVNVMGTFRVNKVFLPLLLKQKGRIINISSETGWQTAAPFNGAYAMSKHAIEAYSDALRRELSMLGIDVIKVQPGPFKTNMVKSIDIQFKEAALKSRYFSSVINRLRQFAMKQAGKGADPVVLAKTIVKAIDSKSPKTRYSVRPDPARTALEYMPVQWSDWVLKKVLGG